MTVEFYLIRSKSLNSSGFELSIELRKKLSKNDDLFDYRILALDTKGFYKFP